MQAGVSIPVAVVMSVFGRDEAPLLERALDSIFRQDYRRGPVRLYLCTDGPLGPEAAAALERQAGRIHRLVRNEINLGLARSLNRLLDALEDEAFVCRMDSDDFSHAHRISAQVAALEARPDVDILGAAIREVRRDGTALRTVNYPLEHDAIRRLIPRRNPLAHPTVCFRRGAVQAFRHYPEVGINQDWALWFECLARGLRFANLEEALVDMTVSDDFFRRRGAQRALEEFRVSCRGIRRLHGWGWRHAYPLMRLAFRLLPQPLIRLAYRSRLR